MDEGVEYSLSIGVSLGFTRKFLKNVSIGKDSGGIAIKGASKVPFKVELAVTLCLGRWLLKDSSGDCFLKERFATSLSYLSANSGAALSSFSVPCLDATPILILNILSSVNRSFLPMVGM